MKISQGIVVREPEVLWDPVTQSVTKLREHLAFLAQLGVKCLEPSSR